MVSGSKLSMWPEEGEASSAIGEDVGSRWAAEPVISAPRAR